MVTCPTRMYPLPDVDTLQVQFMFMTEAGEEKMS